MKNRCFRVCAFVGALALTVGCGDSGSDGGGGTGPNMKDDTIDEIRDDRDDDIGNW